MGDKPAFGFQSLDEFKPKPITANKQQNKAEIDEVDAVGENLGFTPRNTSVERRKKKGITKPVEQFNIRAHVEDINRFVEYAETTNKSYREIFEEIVKKLPKD